MWFAGTGREEEEEDTGDILLHWPLAAVDTGLDCAHVHQKLEGNSPAAIPGWRESHLCPCRAAQACAWYCLVLWRVSDLPAARGGLPKMQAAPGASGAA